MNIEYEHIQVSQFQSVELVPIHVCPIVGIDSIDLFESKKVTDLIGLLLWFSFWIPTKANKS